MTHLKIVAFDPGVHVGIAWRDDNGKLGATMIYNNLVLTYKYIINRPDVVVFEDFETSGNISKDGLYTVRVVGGIQALCLEHHVPCVLQIPQARYSTMDEAKAYIKRTLGRGKYTPHHIDALAHLLAYESRQHIPPPRMLPTGVVRQTKPAQRTTLGSRIRNDLTR